MPFTNEGKAGIGLALLALLGTGALAVAPEQLWIGWTMFSLAISGWIALLVHHFHPGLSERKGFVLVLVGTTLIIVGSILGLVGAFQMDSKTESKADDAPDVSLKFIYEKSPALVLQNRTGIVAKNIKWTVVLWNLDNPRIYSGPETPENADHHEPLQIPVGMFDFIRPHSDGGPQNIFDTPLVKPYIKPGDRLFGSASSVCPDCKRGHTYVVSIVVGQGGWYGEIADEESGNVYLPSKLSRVAVAVYVDALSRKIPDASRIAIVG